MGGEDSLCNGGCAFSSSAARFGPTAQERTGNREMVGERARGLIAWHQKQTSSSSFPVIRVPSSRYLSLRRRARA